MGKKNLMSSKDNLLMRAYREKPQIVREILETARHESSALDKNRVKDYILYETGVDDTCHILKIVPLAMGAVEGGTLLAIMGSSLPEKLLGVSVGVSGLWYFVSKVKESNGIREEYHELKENADRNLGYKRVRGSNQLEFLFQ